MLQGDPKALVVDASVAAKWHLTDEEHTDKARLLLPGFASGLIDLWAPNYIRYEVPSAIAAAARGRAPRISPEQGMEAIGEFLSLGLKTVDTAELISDAYLLVHRHDCAFYDALYLALAQILDAPLITADRKLYQRISELPKVIWIGDYSPPTPNDPLF
ncbi:MAG TPA: type II toxin-antitoxin system VapC family toxin [Dehalococcoidia bacterium]|nr:type II toxin-antitoxin system VapC family toxin [Dehalococcoidia bacterium]